jgi:hypothetical protein
MCKYACTFDGLCEAAEASTYAVSYAGTERLSWKKTGEKQRKGRR